MELATGFTSNLYDILAVGIGKNFKLHQCQASELSRIGLPHRKTKRRTEIVDFNEWEPVDIASYCSAVRVPMLAGQPIRHCAYRAIMADGVEIVVPALALMRAFFRPANPVFDAAFTAANVDRLAYVDLSNDAAEVIAMQGRTSFSKGHLGREEDRHVRWLKTSWSARTCAQSAHSNATQGWIALDLPRGTFRMVFNGVRVGSSFFVTAASLDCVYVPADDSMTGRHEYFYLKSQERHLKLPEGTTLEHLISDREWRALAVGLPKSTGRTQVELVLHRIMQGRWPDVDGASIVEAGHVMQEWIDKGIASRVVDQLAMIRDGLFRRIETRPGYDLAFWASNPFKDPEHTTMPIFLDTEFIEDDDGIHLLSIGLVSPTGEFYAERDLSTLAAEVAAAGEFIERSVLPQIGRIDAVRGTMDDIAQALAAWLDGLGTDRASIRYDFNRDYALVEQLLSLLERQPRVRLDPTHVGYLLEDADGIRQAEQCWAELEKSRGIGRHHSLADAIALRARFVAVHGPD